MIDKTAEQMFIKLGYEKVVDSKYTIIYKKQTTTGNYKYIDFDRILHIFRGYYNIDSMAGVYSFDELKAINKQIEEFGDKKL